MIPNNHANIKTSGKNNVIEFCDNFRFFDKINCSISGENNTIQVGNVNINQRGNLKIHINGNNNIVKIDDGVIINHNLSLSFFAGGLGAIANDCSIKIASNTFFNGSTSLICGEKNTNILIGADCLFANNIRLITTDNHSIYDISTLKRVNQAGDVKLGNHIWVCEDVTCLNNSSVADNCVIATKSLVTKHLTDENCVYGGIPAKKIKSNINWDTQIKDKFMGGGHKPPNTIMKNATFVDSNIANNRVGIIIPIYNAEKYLEKCLDSVVNQTHTNLEILLIDDGSTDNSCQIAKEYAANDERITLILKDNAGQSSARNIGIDYFNQEYQFIPTNKEIEKLHLFKIKNLNNTKILTTKKLLAIPKIDYLIFLDSDDSWDLDCLKKCVTAMNNKNIDIVWFHLSFIYKLNYKSHWVITPKQLLQDMINNQIDYFFFVWGGMIRFNFLKKIKLKFLEGVMHEYHFFGICLFLQARNIYILKDNLYKYFTSINSVTRGKNLSLGTLQSFYNYANDAIDYVFFDILKKTRSKQIYKEISRLIINEHIYYYILTLKDDELKELAKKCFFGKHYFQTFLPAFSFIRRCSYSSAKMRISNHLAYKLGSAMISNSKSLSGYIQMPFIILYIYYKHQKEQKEYQAKIAKNPALKLPPLESCADYQESLKYKEHLSFKLGLALIESQKMGGGA